MTKCCGVRDIPIISGSEFFTTCKDKQGVYHRMDRGLAVTEQKLAEKLTILTERGKGMLTRIYNIKKAPQLQSIISIQNEVMKGLSNYYFTFVDIMEFKDHACELLTAIDASFVNFDITLNFDLTKTYLDLIVTFASLMIMVSRVEDRKSVLGLFNHAFEMRNGRRFVHVFYR
ncbi:hypothetical protein QZH41_004178 [Actinostola sp. cb2023]|nr:hypothetical protein QZH41_004178 [Actinostola sp. cb2023]